MKNPSIKIIAGPCSVDQHNKDELYKIAQLKVNQQQIVAGLRVVGLKSRSSLNIDGNGMGIDYQSVMNNLKISHLSVNFNPEIPPSVQIAKELVAKTGKLIATEIMLPEIQIPAYEKAGLPNSRALFWNPAVNQLGWQIGHTNQYTKKHSWYIGIKNGKWIGDSLSSAQDLGKQTPIDKTWQGLASFTADSKDRSILIHRGFDIPEKGNYRNLPIHQVAHKAKLNTSLKLYFDPSHIFGPQKRDQIIQGTLDALQMKINPHEYLYDGILIEVGNSTTDTHQHITLDELKDLTTQILKFRHIDPDF